MTTRDAHAAMPIAIIGIGCRFPGGIVDPESFWQVLVNGVDAISDIPADRFDIERFYDPKPGKRGKVTTRFGGFVRQPLEEFDAAFFGISRSYAERLDPQQRLLLETAWEAMEDAGLDIVGMQGSNTGIFVGQWVSDYEHRLFADTGGIDFQMAMGSGRYAAAGRLSFAFGFRGASLSIDAACSSGLASVHLAMRSLHTGDSKVALAGGVNMILEPHIHLAYSYSKMLAADGRCRFGDDNGGGYVRSEGAGIVVLKPLDAAIADGDHIYAVLRGSAVNNDGNSSGAMGRPSVIGQAELIRSALRDGGVLASQLQYVEAHGTGTRAGDPVELSALGAVLSDDRASDAPPTWVGSVKTNFGHTEAAAGVAGLIKAALMLERRMIPPSLHFVTPNAEVSWSTLPIAIPTTLMPWPSTHGPRFAGVSSYGIGGTNAHVVLESAPESQTARVARDANMPLLLPLSARSRTALRAMVAQYAERLAGDRCDAAAVCFSAATRRSALPYRAAFVASDRAALQALVSRAADGEAPTVDGVVHDSARRRVAFVVPGQGAQWVGMARRFFATNAAFHDAIVACDAAARRVVPWSIVEQLFLDADAADYIGDRIDVIQPTLVALSIAYAAWLRSIGVEPDAVVGHSLGEVGAAAIAGALDIETAMRIICLRSALMLRTSGQGAMAVVDLSQSDLEQRLVASGSAVTISVSNSPRSTVVSGAPANVNALLSQLDRDGVYARLVKVDVASHGPQMDPLVPQLVDALRDIRPVDGAVPMYSSVEATRTSGAAFDAEYWGRNLRQPVQFARTIDAMIADGITAFIELGPHPVLSYAIVQTADAMSRDVMTVACGARDTDDQQSATAVIAALWAKGAAIEWTRVLPCGGSVVPLPLYPWQRERFWLDTSGAATRTAAMPLTSTANPFLGMRIDTAADGGGVEWDVRFSTVDAAWLADHVVRGSAIVPAAAVIDVMAAAVRELLGATRDVELRQVVVSEAIPLRADSDALRLVAHRSTDTLALQLRAKDESGWRVVASASGSVVAADRASHTVSANSSAPSDATDGAAHYARMRRRELSYGPSFQVVSATSTSGPSSSAAMTSASDSQVTRRVTLLDGALQSLLALAPPAFASPHETIVPVGVARVVIRATEWPNAATASAHRTAITDGGVLSGDLQLHDDFGAEYVALSGVQMQVVRGTAEESLAALRYQIAWTPVTLASTRVARTQWLVVHDAGGVGARVAGQLRAAGHDVRDWFAHDLHDAHSLPIGTQHVVICTSLDIVAISRADTLDAALLSAYDAPLRVIQLAAASDAPKSVIIVTDGAVAVTSSGDVTAPTQSAAWGLSRVARHEHPSIGCIVVDAKPDALASALLSGLTSADDAELAWRDGQWWASRIEAVRAAAPPLDAAATVPTSYTADVVTPGVVDSVGWRETAPRALSPDDVLIAVAASGLNFLDLLVVLNAYPATEPGDVSAAPALGLECAGVVLRVGSAVRSVSAGDRVMAVCEGGLASHVVAKDALVVRIPDGVSFENASSFPIAFLTAARALEEVAHLSAGERVLIHSAGGGVGLAAMQIARNRGAEIFATAGTAEKRAMLREMGVEHVFDSRDLTWGDDVLAATNGGGVDVVLNSLSGAAIETGFRVLAAYGRFVEIGKRDVFGETRIGLRVFRKQVSVTSVYLLEQMRMDAAPLGALLRDLVARLTRGELTPLPVTAFAADQVAEACRALVPGTHVGKMVVTHQSPPSAVRRAALHAPVRDDATYLISGGLGALGQRAAAWLVSRGARHLLLVGRSAPSDDAQRTIDAWKARNVAVTTLAIDIATENGIAQVRTALAMLPALRGVIHAAGVLDDGLLEAQTPARMRTVAAAKVGGALQLLTLPGFETTDFMVMYSSVAGTLGTRGQSNYAAANAMLDALAQSLRARGVRATSIAFGPFAGVGLATEGRRLDMLGLSGLGALRPAHADAALDALAGSAHAHEMVAVFDRAAWLGVFETPTERRWLHADGQPAVVVEAARAEVGLRARLATVVGDRQRGDVVLQFVQQEVAAVLRSSPDRVEPLKPLRAMGIDSLTALELRNRLEQSTGLRLAGTLVFNYPNAAAIAAHVLERLKPESAAPSVVAAPVQAAAVGVDDELDALAREMSALDDDALRQLLAEHGTGDGA